MDKKPLNITCGGYHTDSNFDVVLLSLSQVTKIAKNRLKRNKCYGLKLFKVIDKETYWSISIY